MFGRLVTTVLLLGLMSASCGSDGRFVNAEPGEQFRYGEDRRHVGVIYRAAGDRKLPVVVLIHGGFWRDRYALDLMAPLIDGLVTRGFAVWNLEYRGVGQASGGFPETLDDVANGINYLRELAEDYQLNLDRVGFVGHSAGGHLALWAAGADLDVDPVVAVGQAAVVDLVTAAEANLGSGAVQAMMGGEPGELPSEYAQAQPRVDERSVLIHGDLDDTVPLWQSTNAADDAGSVVVIAGEGHFAHLDPESKSWAAVLAALEGL